MWFIRFVNLFTCVDIVSIVILFNQNNHISYSFSQRINIRKLIANGQGHSLLGQRTGIFRSFMHAAYPLTTKITGTWTVAVCWSNRLL